MLFSSYAQSVLCVLIIQQEHENDDVIVDCQEESAGGLERKNGLKLAAILNHL
jgi:hypothetical protein